MTDKKPYEGLNIYQRLHMAMEKVSYIQKTSEVSMGKGSYKAVTHDEVTAKVRVALMKFGIAAHPISITRRTTPLTITKVYNGQESQSTNYYTEVDLSYRFVNVGDPKDFIDVPAIGDGIDPQDKSAGKALSMAVKNALLKALMLETGENEESRVEGDVGVFPMNKTGNRTTDKWVNNAISDLKACTNLQDLKLLFGDFWNDSKKKGCTEDQRGMIQMQYENMKAALADKIDDIPDFSKVQ